MTSRFQPPPIIKACERLLVGLEDAVRGFPRYHRYQIGADLRRQATKVFHLANRAWRDQAQRRYLVQRLVWDVDDLKQSLQTAKLVKAFVRGFGQFEELVRQLDELGAQVGGWHRQLQQHPSAQNAPARRGAAQRGQKLSARTASTGANR